jgi:hypothetical protein
LKKIRIPVFEHFTHQLVIVSSMNLWQSAYDRDLIHPTISLVQ